ncbi:MULTISPECIES: hypothetical protein [Halomonas]|uniref:hypothetical protein n=1 Tax=Halomonas TaxID=2745 RepID=UPI001868FA34|nr:hypothetical protein [Halomonas citrativorans]
MSRNLPSIDRPIIELLLKPENTTFCVQGLRDQYIEQYDVNPALKAPLRRFIYERVKKLVKAQFVRRDSERRKRGQQFHVNSILMETDLGTDDDDFPAWLQRTHPQLLDEPVINDTSQSPSERSKREEKVPADSHKVLEKKLNEAQSRFFESLGEVETFQQLMTDHPELESSLLIDFRSAHERSSRLLGHVSALEKALNRLGSS